MNSKIIHQFRFRSPIFDWYLSIFGFWCFFQKSMSKLACLCLKTSKVIYYTCFYAV